MSTLDPRLGLTNDTVSLGLVHGVPPVTITEPDGQGWVTVECGQLVLHGHADHVGQLILDLGEAHTKVTGYGLPFMAVGADLAEYVGHQFRAVEFVWSDGKFSYSPWRTIVAVDGSPFGNSVSVTYEVRGSDGVVSTQSWEIGEDDAVQVRRRLPLAEVGEAKAVA